MWRRGSNVCTVAFVLVLAARPASGLGDLRYGEPVAHALGVPAYAAGILRDDVAPRAWAAVGERSLFGIAGLNAAHTVIGLRLRGATVMASSVVVRSPVGREAAGALSVGVGLPAAARLWVELAGWSLAIDGGVSSHVAMVNLGAASPPVHGLSIAYMVEGVRVAGYPLEGADTSAMLVARASGITGVAGLRITRDGEATVWTGVRAHLGMLEAAAGYHDVSSSVDVALSLAIASVDVSLGASSHPVLGMSRSVFLRWVWR